MVHKRHLLDFQCSLHRAYSCILSAKDEQRVFVLQFLSQSEHLPIQRQGTLHGLGKIVQAVNDGVALCLASTMKST